MDSTMQMLEELFAVEEAYTKDAFPTLVGVGHGVVAASATGDRILTSDAGDIQALVTASGRSVLVVPC